MITIVLLKSWHHILDVRRAHGIVPLLGAGPEHIGLSGEICLALALEEIATKTVMEAITIVIKRATKADTRVHLGAGGIKVR